MNQLTVKVSSVSLKQSKMGMVLIKVGVASKIFVHDAVAARTLLEENYASATVCMQCVLGMCSRELNSYMWQSRAEIKDYSVS